LQQTDFDEVKVAFETLPGVKSAILADSGNGAIHVDVSCRDGADIRPELYQVIKERDWVLLEFHMQTRSLETIFRELTREN
ncbi:MAG: hypothetical protein R3231_12820, partial [bacterium]|nr:hypothetical protein [bacterium]